MRIFSAILLVFSFGFANNADVYKSYLCKSLKDHLPDFLEAKEDDSKAKKIIAEFRQGNTQKGKNLGFNKKQIDSLEEIAFLHNCPETFFQLNQESPDLEEESPNPDERRTDYPEVKTQATTEKKDQEKIDLEYLNNFKAHVCSETKVLLSRFEVVNFGSTDVLQIFRTIKRSFSTKGRSLRLSEPTVDSLVSLTLREQCPVVFDKLLYLVGRALIMQDSKEVKVAKYFCEQLPPVVATIKNHGSNSSEFNDHMNLVETRVFDYAKTLGLSKEYCEHLSGLALQYRCPQIYRKMIYEGKEFFKRSVE